MHYNGLPKATKENARNFFSKAALLAWEQCILYHLTNQSLEQNFAWKSANLPISVRRGLTPLPDSEKIVWCRDRRLLHIVFVKAAPSKAWRHGWPAVGAKTCRARASSFFLSLFFLGATSGTGVMRIAFGGPLCVTTWNPFRNGNQLL